MSSQNQKLWMPNLQQLEYIDGVIAPPLNNAIQSTIASMVNKEFHETIQKGTDLRWSLGGSPSDASTTDLLLATTTTVRANESTGQALLLLEVLGIEEWTIIRSKTCRNDVGEAINLILHMSKNLRSIINKDLHDKNQVQIYA